MTTLDIKNRSNGRHAVHWLLLACSAILLIGCTTHSGRRAPIEERGREMNAPVKKAPPAPALPTGLNAATGLTAAAGLTAATGLSARTGLSTPPALPQTKKIIVSTLDYAVKKGDTLYSISFFHGIDYRELAELNNIKNPGEISIGQHLQIPVFKEVKIDENKSQSSQGEGQKVAPVTKEAEEEEKLEWGMPTEGKITAGFSEPENRKGIDIAGKRGQAVLSSAAGKVVYNGSGLRGYGKLVIIKHNKTFLSAYAHNEQVLVKEGQNVTKGQKIAEMGDSDSDQVSLHFEIRKLGKPVDPAQYLPMTKP